VGAGLALVAGLHDDVDLLAERVEQVHEDLEEPLRGDGGGQHGHGVARFGVAVDVAAVSFARDDFQAERGADRVGQPEAPVATDPEVGVELVLAQVVEAGSGHMAGVGAEHPLEEPLDEAHGKGTPPPAPIWSFRGRSSVTAPRDRSRGTAPEPFPGDRTAPRPKVVEAHPGDGPPFRWHRSITVLLYIPRVAPE